MDFKEHFDYELANRYASAVAAIDSEFNQAVFANKLGKNLLDLEMKGRVDLIAESLWLGLDKPFEQAIEVIIKATETGFRGFPVWVASQIVEKYGVGDFEPSMKAIYQLTQLFTGEFAIRPFLDKYPEQSFALLEQWSTDESVDVRRLVSEGIRPRLPWAARVDHLLIDPSQILPLLSRLKDDPAEYVRRSVANNLNDISKDHPKTVIDTVSGWLETADASKELDWLVRHALRTLLKNGNDDALGLMGYDVELPLQVKQFSASPNNIDIGGKITLSCEIAHFNDEAKNLMIDYIWFSPSAKGKTNRKVFKWSKRELRGVGSFLLNKSISVKPNTVRKIYSGQHEIQLIVNGKQKATCTFDVKDVASDNR